jgi:hypothetical protein
MHVDETWRHHETGGVDDTRSILVGKVADHGDRISADPDIGRAKCVA